jgi:hypothetical protein
VGRYPHSVGLFHSGVVLGFYVTAALAVIALILTLPAIFDVAGSVSGF